MARVLFRGDDRNRPVLIPAVDSGQNFTLTTSPSSPNDKPCESFHFKLIERPKSTIGIARAQIFLFLSLSLFLHQPPHTTQHYRNLFTAILIDFFSGEHPVSFPNHRSHIKKKSSRSEKHFKNLGSNLSLHHPCCSTSTLLGTVLHLRNPSQKICRGYVETEPDTLY